MLFSREIEDLHDDGFEDSIDEHRIFTEVFFGGETDGTSKRCLVTGVINFECDYSQQKDAPPCSNSENFALTSQDDSCNLKRDFRGNSEQGCFSEGLTFSMRNDHETNAKRMKLSGDEVFNCKPCLGKVLSFSAHLKEVVSGVSHAPFNSICHPVTCRLVESSSQGVTSSCYLLKPQGPKVVTDIGNVVERDVSQCKLSCIDGSERKEIVVNKAVASPVSQESCAAKLLAGNPTIFIANKCESLRFSKPKWKETSFVKVDLGEILLNRNSTKNPRSCLRYHINRLLIASGWEIGRRRRANKSNGLGEFVYRSPQGRPIREFYRAWDLCGQSLFDDANCDVWESNGKQWTCLAEFWSDLSNTFVRIEKLLDSLETNATFAHWWCLLDPFANVVFIDKTIRMLEKGKKVKAKRSFVIDLYTKSENLSFLKNVDSCKGHVDRLCHTPLLSNSELTVSEGAYCARKEQCGEGSSVNFERLQNDAVKAQERLSFYSSEGKCVQLVDTIGGNGTNDGQILGKKRSRLDQGSFPACGSDITCNQPGSCPFEVPACSGNVNIMLEGSQTVSHHQDSSACFQSCDGESCDYNGEMPLKTMKEVSMGSSEFMQHYGQTKEGGQCVEAPKFVADDPSFASNIISKKKEHNKSKKISEIRLTTSYQNDAGLYTSCGNEMHGMDGIGIRLASKGILQLDNLRSNKNGKKSPACYSHWPDKQQFRSKKFWRNSYGSKKLVQFTYNSNHPKELNFENGTDDPPLDMKNESMGTQTCRHIMTSQRPETLDENEQKRSIRCHLKDDDLLISAVIKNKSFGVSTKQTNPKSGCCKSKYLRKRKSQKGSCRLLPRSLNRGGRHFMEVKWSTFGSRTVLSWLIHSGVVTLNEIIQYRNPKDDNVVKDGLVTQDGILCRCCDEVFSVSAFRTHAGFRMNRPSLNLFMESGKPFALCQLEAWSAEYKARRSSKQTVHVDETDQNDDSCGLCGDGGELICCDNCPSTFHQACLYAEELPAGNWYCPYCTCRICGVLVTDTEVSEDPGAFKCLQCENKYHETCLKANGENRGVAPGNRFCCGNCLEVFSGLQARIGLMNFLSDGFSWTLLRCIHGDQKILSAHRFVALKAECNSKLAVGLTIMEECFLPMFDSRTGIDMIPHVLYNWGSQFARLNYHGFYTVVLEKDDVLMSVASIRIHGVTVAEMPLIATCSKYRRQGMCRRLMNSIEEMLKSFKVEKLVISAIPSLVETWTCGFGFKPFKDNERESLSSINLMVFPGTVWLKKHLLKNQATDQQFGMDDSVDACHVPPSGDVDLTESRALSGESPAVEATHQSDPNLCIEGDVEMGTTDQLQVGESQGVSLHKQFSKLSCEEVASLSEGSHLEVVCQVESLEVNDDKHSLTQQSLKTHLER